ncbi:hypothetical protein [Acidovorax sp. BL-A-41-H1]|uniref:hypothetical protein n=1 Tax=Acidovorax sp. BL-A-41-H1 TaxID=3421102 RepID=UPI003F79CF1B
MNGEVKGGGPAFPVDMNYTTQEGIRTRIASDGMTIRQYAAIHLCIPESGTDWLDDMIRKAARDKIAAKAMQGSLADGAEIYKHDEFARWCYELADEMLKVGEGGAA